MSSKRRKSRSRSSSSSPRDRQQRSRSYILLAAVIILAIVGVGVIILLDQGAGNAPARAGDLGSEKSLGADDAPVVVVEYSDFQCPYCQQFATGPGQQLREEYVEQGQVRFVYRHFAFIGDESLWAAEASECANEQGRFWDYHDKLFDEQAGENQGAFSKDNLRAFAAELGLDTEQFDQCFASGRYQVQVQEDIQDAQRRRINSTPSILVDGQYIPNGASYPVLQAVVEAALDQP
jgi:protein-disulfide isomerase